MLNLGIVYNENFDIINHRSLLKVLLNPFLRILGFCIATYVDEETGEIGSITIIKSRFVPPIESFKMMKYDFKKEWFLLKKRRIF